MARALKPNGVFVFDVNSEYKLSQIYGSNTYAEIRDGWSYIWENTYDPEQGICQMDLAFYIQDPDGRFTQYRERHYEIALDHEEIVRALASTGFSLLGVYGDDFVTSPGSDTERWTYLAVKGNVGS